MPKHRRFTPRVEEALAELAGLPWRDYPGDGIRCCGVCPVSAVATAVGHRDGYGNEYITSIMGAGFAMGWTVRERCDVMCAADYPDDPRRPRLMELLGMTR